MGLSPDRTTKTIMPRHLFPALSGEKLFRKVLLVKKKRFHASVFSLVGFDLYGVSQAFQGHIILVCAQPLHHGPFTFFDSIEGALAAIQSSASTKSRYSQDADSPKKKDEGQAVESKSRFGALCVYELELQKYSSPHSDRP